MNDKFNEINCQKDLNLSLMENNTWYHDKYAQKALYTVFKMCNEQHRCDYFATQVLLFIFIFFFFFLFNVSNFCVEFEDKTMDFFKPFKFNLKPWNLNSFFFFFIQRETCVKEM